MDTQVETRPAVAYNDPRVESQMAPVGAPVRPYGEAGTSGPLFSGKDYVAGAVMAIIMIGPLAAAAIGRMAT